MRGLRAAVDGAAGLLRVLSCRWLAVWAGLVAALVLLGFQSPFPTGSDGGHMLAFSRWFLGEGVHPSWTYGPAMPAVYGLLDMASVGSRTMLHALIKLWSLASFMGGALLVAGAHGLLGGRPRAVRVTFAAYIAGPLVPFVNLWGDTAQMWGFGLSALAVAGLVASHRSRKGAAIAAWSTAAVAYTHWYSLVFTVLACGACVVIMLLAAPRRALPWMRDLMHPALPAALATLPAAWAILVRTRPLLKDSGWHGLSGEELHRLWQALLPNPHHLAVLFAWLAFVVVLLVYRMRRPRPDAVVATASTVMLLGMALLFFATPEDIVDRVVFFLAVPLALWIGEVASRPGRAFPWAMAALAVAGSTTFVAYLHDAPFFSPLADENAHAFDVLARGEGGVLVTGPQPNIDAWWMEGTAGRLAFVYEDPRFYSFRDEIRRSWTARSLTMGNEGWRGQDQWWAVAPSGTVHGLAPRGDALETMGRLEGPGAPTVDGGPAGLALSWQRSGDVVLHAPQGGWFHALEVDDELTLTTRWSRSHGSGPEVRIRGEWNDVRVSEDERVVTLLWTDRPPVLEIVLGEPVPWDIAREAHEAGVTAVYLRDPAPWLLARWSQDPCTDQVFQEGRTWVLEWRDC